MISKVNDATSMPRRVLAFLILTSVACGRLVSPCFAADAANVSGDATLSIDAGTSQIVIKTTSRLAGAIDSLTWSGQEFVDSYDHGRQIQSAATFDCARPGEFWPECFNPTEAGSSRDGVGETTTSRLLRFEPSPRSLFTEVQMAFWLAPGETSSNRLAINEKPLSDHQLTKRITLGKYDSPHLIDFEITFTVPDDEHHHLGQFEALTGYMPPLFTSFYAVDSNTGKRSQLDEGPGEQPHPLIFATPSGSHAMGVYSPDQPSKGYEHAGYGRFKFKQENVVKWNCVFRERNADRLPAGDYQFSVVVAVGDLETVTREIHSLLARHSAP
jgi:hypothetical protein